MAFSAKKRAKVVAALNEKWKQTECPFCGVNRWDIDGYVLLDVSTRLGGVLSGQAGLMNAYVACQNCGYTALFNLKPLGLVAPESDEPEEE